MPPERTTPLPLRQAGPTLYTFWNDDRESLLSVCLEQIQMYLKRDAALRQYITTSTLRPCCMASFQSISTATKTAATERFNFL